MSIRLRLTLRHTVLLGMVLLVLSFIVYRVVAGQSMNRLDVTLRAHAIDLLPVEAQRPGRGKNGPKDECAAKGAPADAINTLGEDLYVVVYDACGNAVAQSRASGSAAPVDQATLRRVLGGNSAFASVDGADERVRLYGRPLSDGPGRASGAIFLALPLGPTEADLFRLQLLLAAIISGTLVATAAGGWLLARDALRPVDQMTRAAASIGEAADFSRRLPEPEQRDEIGRLAHTFNEMLGQLAAAFGAQQQFLADASHELRTPLTAIRARLENAIRAPDPEPAQREATLRAITSEVDRMGRLVDSLLTLARSDAGERAAHLPVPLDAVALDVYHHARPLAGGVRLLFGEFQPVDVVGDPDRLKQLLLNLVDNALAYTPEGGTVTLDLVKTPGEATIRVGDTGAGIPAENLPRIFERFYRVDASRSGRTGGSGLGLAICKEVAEAHGGRIAVESRVGEGTTFTVTLPIGGAPAVQTQAEPTPNPVGVGAVPRNRVSPAGADA
ncbi:MAG: sensor histidine kinase [Thermomicrobiales bacterium]